MPSPFLDFHRQRTGDSRSDSEIILEIAERSPELFERIPDLKSGYDALINSLREPYEPTAGEEFKLGLSRGTRGLTESIYGFGALGAKVFGADELAGKLADESQQQGELASEAKGSVPTYKEIHDAGSLGRYLLGGVGEVLPSAAEAVVIAAGGALAGGSAGSAAAPGAGTVAGAGAGAVTGLIARQAAKSLLKKGVSKLTRELVEKESKAIARRYGAYLATALNSYALNSGEVYADLVQDKKVDPDRAVNAALLGGFVASVPDAFLPSYVAGKFLKGAAGKEIGDAAKNSFYSYLLRMVGEAAKTAPMEAATEGFQEWVSIAAGHWAKGDAPVFGSLTDAEKERVINASALGAIGGGVFAPIAAIPSGVSPDQLDPRSQPPPTAGQPPIAPAAPAAPQPTVVIPEALKAYTEELTPDDQVQLEAIARQELRGEPMAIEQRDALERNAGLSSAYTIIKEQMASGVAAQDETIAVGESGRAASDATENPEAQVAATPVAFPPQANLNETAATEPVQQEAPQRSAPPEPLQAQVAATPEAQAVPSPPADLSASPVLTLEAQEELLVDLDETKAVPRATTSGQTSVASFFRVEPQPFSTKLAEQLTRNHRSGPNSFTRQIAFFLDNQTGEVVGLGTTQVKGTPETFYQDEFRVGRPPGAKSGTTLRTLMADGRYVPLGSMTKKTVSKYATTSFRFPNLEAFEAFSQKAEAKLQASIGDAAQVQAQPTAAVYAGEEGNAQKEVIQIEETTPADVLAAKEGFTEDEATAIWDALQGVKPLEIGAALIRKANNKDLVQAIRVMARIVSENDESLTTEEIKSYILDAISVAQASRGAGQEAFVESLTSIVGQPIRVSLREGGGGVQEASGSPVPPTGAAGTEPSAAGSGGQVAADAGDRGQEVRFHRGTFEENYRGQPPEVAAAFQSAVSALANAGYDVNLLQQEQAHFATEFGQIDNANQIVSLVMANVAEPTTDNLYHLNAEVAHAVFAGLPTEQQARLQQAVRGVTDVFLGIPSARINDLKQRVETLRRLKREVEGRVDEIEDVERAKVAGTVYEGQTPFSAARQTLGVLGEINGELADLEREITSSGFAISPSVPAAQRGAVEQEERLVDVVARSITANGFNAAEANSLAQRFWRFLKEAFLRASLALGRAWGITSAEAQAKLASAYLQVRVEQFLAGNAKPWSFTDFMGGPRPSAQQRNLAFDFGNGATGLSFRWNTEEGRMEVQEVTPDSLAAIFYNAQNATIRYHGPKSRNATAQVSPDVAETANLPDVAAQNEFSARLHELFTNWESLGNNVAAVSEQDFRNFILREIGEDPAAIVAAINDLNQKAGKPPIDPALRMGKLNESAQRETAYKSLSLLTGAAVKWGALNDKASYETSGEPGSNQRKFDRGVLRIQNLVTNYTDALYIFGEVRGDILGWAEWLKSNSKRISALAHKDGVLEQIIRETEGRLDEPLSNDYYDAINKLVNRFAASDSTKVDFVEMLQSLAATGITWDQMSGGQITNALRSPELEQATAGTFDLVAGTPTLGLLRESSMEARALRTIAAAFLKRNAMMADFLALRASKDFSDRAEVNAALKTAMSDQRNAFANARRDLKKQNRLHERATRLLVKLEEMQGDQRLLLDELQRQRNFIAFHESAKPLLEQQMAVYEKAIGAVSEIFEPYPNAEMIWVENENEPASAVAKRIRLYPVARSEVVNKELQEQLQLADKWLEAHPEGGAVFNRLQAQTGKIRENIMQSQNEVGFRRLVQSIAGAAPTKLDQVGLASTKALARGLRNYDTSHYEVREFSQKISNRWSVAVQDARRRLGFSKYQIEPFLKRFYDPAWNYLTRRLDLQFGAATDEAAFESKMAALRTHFALPAREWEALDKLLRTTAEVNREVGTWAAGRGIKVKDEALGVYRSLRGPKGEILRHLTGVIERVYQQMRDGPWSGDPLKGRNLATEYQADPMKFRQELAPLFAGETWQWFVEPLARRGGRAAFLAVPDATGFSRLASVAETSAAIDRATKGDVVSFAEELFQLSGGTSQAALPAFVAETLSTFQAYYQMLHSAHQENSNALAASMQPVGHVLMDGRTSDEMPDAWVEHQRYDLHSTRALLNKLALHSAFGRNLETAGRLFADADKSLKKMEDEFITKVTDPLVDLARGQHRFEARRIANELAKKAGYTLRQLEEASRQRKMVQFEMTRFQQLVATQGGLSVEFRWWSELMSSMVALVVQGPKTALVDTSSMAKPIQIFGAGKVGVAYTYRGFRATAQQVAGGFLEMVGLKIKSGSDHIARLHRLNQFPTADNFDLRSRVTTAALGYPLAEGQGLLAGIARGAAVASRGFREALGTPLPSLTKAKDREFLRPKPAAFTYLSQAMHLGSIQATWETFDNFVTDAAQFLANPGNGALLADPAFLFTSDQSSDLGYSKREFERLNAMLQKNGLTLERLARNYALRLKAGTGGPVMGDGDYRQLLVVGPAELMQEASLQTRPSLLITDPFWHLATPLMGWSVSQTASLDKTITQPISGARDWYGLLHFAPLLGVGLAYALMADWYDEWVIKKKTNRLQLTGDNLALAVLDRTAQVGTLGIVGEVANGLINVSTAREVSIDSRVFMANSLTGMGRAASAWYHQGTPSYSTVGRPLFMALGGSGALQYLQIFNNLTGVDNAESRATSRVNVNNWLRVAGRSNNLPVRTQRGQQFVPSRTTPWVREMALAAMANDREEFRAAHRAAVESAREDGREDPRDYVKRAYQSQNPLRSVFETRISESEYRKLLLQMPETGRRDVSEALRLINGFGESLGLEPYYGTKDKPLIKQLDRSEVLRREAFRLAY